MRVAEATPSALRQQHALADDGEVGGLLLFSRIGVDLENQRADGHGDLEIASATAGTQRTRAVAATLGFIVGIEAEVDERVAVRVGDEEHGTARATVTAIRSALRDELLTTEAEGPPASVACFDVDVDFVDEHLLSYSTGWTEIKRPR